MTFLATLRFVVHRRGCEAEFSCETCESDGAKVLGMVVDVVLVLAWLAS